MYPWASPEVVSGMTMIQVMEYLESDQPQQSGRRATRAELDAHCEAVRKKAGLD